MTLTEWNLKHWNYRVVVRSQEGVHGNTAVYGIHEVFYDEDGKPESVSVDPVSIVAESVEEVKSELAMQARALESPVLNYDDIPSKE